MLHQCPYKQVQKLFGKFRLGSNLAQPLDAAALFGDAFPALRDVPPDGDDLPPGNRSSPW